MQKIIQGDALSVLKTLPDNSVDIEKEYPEAYKLARRFHELYETTAPAFGYQTREETKEFDPESANGRLMAFVCSELVKEEIEKYEITKKKIAEKRLTQSDMKYKMTHTDCAGGEYDGGIWEIKQTPKSYLFTLIEKPFFESNFCNMPKICRIAKGGDRQHIILDWDDGTFTVYPYRSGVRVPHYFEPCNFPLKSSPINFNKKMVIGY